MSDYTCLIGIIGVVLLYIIGHYLYPEPVRISDYSRGQVPRRMVPEPNGMLQYAKESVALSEWQDAAFGDGEE
jgi:hypothetical protein